MAELGLAQQVWGVWGQRGNEVTHRTQLSIGREARQWAGSEYHYVTLRHMKELAEQRGTLVRRGMRDGVGMRLPRQRQRGLRLGGR